MSEAALMKEIILIKEEIELLKIVLDKNFYQRLKKIEKIVKILENERKDQWEYLHTLGEKTKINTP